MQFLLQRCRAILTPSSALLTLRCLHELAGYVVCVSNFRGCQLSEGVYTGYRGLALGEHHDGYDTVEWLAALPGCSGSVGTFGGSQGGISQNFTSVTHCALALPGSMSTAPISSVPFQLISARGLVGLCM